MVRKMTWMLPLGTRAIFLIALLVQLAGSDAAAQNGEDCSTPPPLLNNDEELHNQGWDCPAASEDPRVCSRAVAGTEIREVLVLTIMPAPPAAVFSVIADYARYPEFMPYVEKSDVLKAAGNETVVFQQLDFPWPISDRYYTIRLVTDTHCAAQESYHIQWDLAPDGVALRVGEGEPLRVNIGSWHLWSEGAGQQTSVRYFVHTDPGGMLPVWVINMANHVAAPKVMDAVRQRASAAAPAP
jgi:ribosome-associated toxin RatA of RatAB toxin-antitoxin module